MSQSLSTIVREMATTLREKVRSPSGDWLRDTAVFIATPQGEIAAINNELHLGSATEMTASLLGPQGIPLEEGDSAISNDPYLGSAHVQDFYLLSPVHYKDAPVFYLGAKCHFDDIGGDVRGGFNSRAEEIWAEGVRISPVKVCREGRIDTGIFNMILLNTRTADPVRLGLEALIAAVESGKKETRSYPQGIEGLQNEARQALAAMENRVGQLVSSWASGEYSGECPLEDDSTQIKGTKVQAKLVVNGSQLEIDLSMNPPQLKKPFNSSRGNTLCFALLPFLPLLAPDVMINGGIWRAITVKTKKGTVVDPLLPAPTSFSPFHVGREISGSVNAAMGEILSQTEKDRVAARLPSLLGWHPKV